MTREEPLVPGKAFRTVLGQGKGYLVPHSLRWPLAPETLPLRSTHFSTGGHLTHGWQRATPATWTVSCFSVQSAR